MRRQRLTLSLLSVLACFTTGTTAESPYTPAARTTALRNSSFVPASASTSALATITGRPPPNNIPLSCYPTELRTTIPPWWGPDIADNTCTTLMNDGCPRWNPCNISVGTVQLMYWSTAANQSWTLPTTLYNSEYDFTFTYPSVYMIYHAISAYNSCNGNKRAPLGPTLTKAIQDWALTDVSTMIPHTYPQEPGSMTDPRQFNPADLYNCTATSSAYTSSDIYGDPGPYAAGHQCNPFMSLSTRVRWLGEPYWRSCGIDNKASRAYDPPSALQMVTALVPASNPDPATTPVIPTALPETTSAKMTAPALDPLPVSATEQKETQTLATASSPPPSAADPQETDISNDTLSPAAVPAQPTTLTTPTSPETTAGPGANGDPWNSMTSQSTEDATPIADAAIEQTDALSLDPEGPTPYASVKDQGKGSSANDDLAAESIEQSSELAPAAAIQVTATAQRVEYLGVTLDYTSAPIVTISSLNAVISYGSQGLVIQYPSGSVSTVAVQGPTTLTSTSPSDPSSEGSSTEKADTEIAEKSKTAGAVSSSNTTVGAGPDASIASVINAIINGGSIPAIPTTTIALSSLTANGNFAPAGGHDNGNIDPTATGIAKGGTEVMTTGTSLLNETSTAASSVVLASDASNIRILMTWTFVSMSCVIMII